MQALRACEQRTIICSLMVRASVICNVRMYGVGSVPYGLADRIPTGTPLHHGFTLAHLMPTKYCTVGPCRTRTSEIPRLSSGGEQ